MIATKQRRLELALYRISIDVLAHVERVRPGKLKCHRIYVNELFDLQPSALNLTYLNRLDVPPECQVHLEGINGVQCLVVG